MDLQLVAKCFIETNDSAAAWKMYMSYPDSQPNFCSSIGKVFDRFMDMWDAMNALHSYNSQLSPEAVAQSDN